MTARCTSTTTCQGQVARPCSLALTVLGTSLAAGYGMQPSHCCCWTSSAESHSPGEARRQAGGEGAGPGLCGRCVLSRDRDHQEHPA